MGTTFKRSYTELISVARMMTRRVHSGTMEDGAVLAANASMLREALG
jgi:hypothetical protein